MRLVRSTVRSRHDAGTLQQRSRIPLVHNNCVVCLRFAERVVQCLVSRERGLKRFPGHFQLSRRADRIPFALGHHTDEILPPNDSHTGDVLDRLLVDAQHLRDTDAQRTLTARPDNPPMQHTWEAHVLDVDIRPGHLVRRIEPRHLRPHDSVFAAGLWRRIVGVLARQLDTPVYGTAS